jgi:peptidoglycan/LPS O-acetylase OafA/YrhL
LWHAPVLAAGDAFKRNALAHGVSVSLAVMLVVTFAASLAMAFATTRLVEIPVLRWRDRHVSDGADPPRMECASGELATQSYTPPRAAGGEAAVLID